MKQPHQGQRWSALAICLGLAGIVWLVFGQALGHEFVNLDDPLYVTANPHIVPGLTSDGIAWAFTHVHASNWHPLTWISHMIDCQLFGLNPRGHHFVNIVLHTASAILLFSALLRMTTAPWRSAFVAAVFAVHPLRVESVAWIAERKDVLSGLFFMLTLLAYARYAQNKYSLLRYLSVVAFFVAGLMCKPMLVTLPLLLLLLDYWPLRRLSTRALLEKLPLFALAGASCLITLHAQTTTVWSLQNLPLSSRLANAATAIIIYLRQMVWPTGLAVFYPLVTIETAAPLLAVALLFGLSLAIFFLRQRRYLVVGWLWYLLMLVPVIGIVQVGVQAHADRYTYLPQIGLYLILTWLAADLCPRRRSGKILFNTAALTVIVALAFVARLQAASWRDSQTLWLHALACAPDNPIARKNLGQAYAERGRTEEAIEQFQRSLAFDPNQEIVHSQLGATLMDLGQSTAAIPHFEAALKLRPKFAGAEMNLGLALQDLGRTEESLQHLQHAVELDPELSSAQYNLGNAFMARGNGAAAVAQFRRAVELAPYDERALNNLAWMLATWPDEEVRDGAAAVEFAARADRLTQSQDAVIHATLAAAHAEAKQFDHSVTIATQAMELALNNGNKALADSIQDQRQIYQTGKPIRDLRYAPATR